MKELHKYTPNKYIPNFTNHTMDKKDIIYQIEIMAIHKNNAALGNG